MKNFTASDNRNADIHEIGEDSTPLTGMENPEKKPYTFPTLKRYTAPTLRKHTSYKDITMLFAVLPPIPPTSP